VFPSLRLFGRSLTPSINSESIMAGRRCLISLSTAHVSEGICSTSAAIA
jgi:hypothetical protein